MAGLAGLAPAADSAAQGAAGEIEIRTARAVLVMVDDRGCVYCARWNRDVRQSYLASPEGQFAPLVQRQRGHPDLAFLPGLRYTPTFVVLAGGREVGRIVGYAGPDFFWGELAGLLARAGFGSDKRAI